MQYWSLWQFYVFLVKLLQPWITNITFSCYHDAVRRMKQKYQPDRQLNSMHRQHLGSKQSEIFNNIMMSNSCTFQWIFPSAFETDDHLISRFKETRIHCCQWFSFHFSYFGWSPQPRVKVCSHVQSSCQSPCSSLSKFIIVPLLTDHLTYRMDSAFRPSKVHHNWHNIKTLTETEKDTETQTVRVKQTFIA